MTLNSGTARNKQTDNQTGCQQIVVKNLSRLSKAFYLEVKPKASTTVCNNHSKHVRSVEPESQPSTVMDIC